MDTFRVLVVDDDTFITDAIRKKYESRSEVEVFIANDHNRATQLILDQFFHAAFVDWNLADGHDKANKDGKLVLADIRDFRASCRRFLLTSQVPIGDMFQLLSVKNSLIVGVVDKARSSIQDLSALDELAGRWLEHRVTVTGLDQVLDELSERQQPAPGPGKPAARLTRHEVDCLVSKIFGQGLEVGCGREIPKAVSEVRLEVVTGGRSRSAVVKAQPLDKSGRKGNTTIIKFSGVEEGRREYLSYCQYVRFMLSLNRRVELLGYYEADTIGAMCYSFAGGSPEGSTSLEKLFLTEDFAKCTRILAALFAPEKQEWYAQVHPSIDQGIYFREAHGFDSDAIQERVQRFATDVVAPAVQGRMALQHESIHLDDGFVFRMPTRALLGRGQLRNAEACIVHGDLNAGNVITATDDDRVFFIDSRHTGPGPRCVDFAALEASVRVFCQPSPIAQATAHERSDLERRVSDTVWGRAPDSVNRHGSPPAPFWARISTLLGQYAQRNFTTPSLTAQEYASTCLFWALRVFKVRQLSDAQRFNLFVWISELVRQLNGPAASAG